MSKWRKNTLRLPENHGWRSKPGFQIFVADRGAVRFDFPAQWHVVPEEDSVKFYDLPPPNDRCLLQSSFIRLPPGIDWTELPLAGLLEQATSDDKRGEISRGETVTAKRGDIEIAWLETRFIDETEKREACSRCGLARGSDIQTLLTLDFWPEDLPRLDPIWSEVLRSLQLGNYIADPTKHFLH